MSSSKRSPARQGLPSGAIGNNTDEILGEVPDSAGMWMDELARAAAAGWGLPELRSQATRLTWVARRLGHPIPVHHRNHGDPSLPGLIALYVCGQRFRFDFNFRGLDGYLDTHKESVHAEDALVQSFRVFTDMGMGRNSGLVSRLDQVLSLTDADTRVRHICLAGLWAAYTLPGQARLLLDLANQMISLDEADGTVYFRRAAAYRMLSKFHDALADIDYALSLLSPGNNEINQDYLRERQLIGLLIHRGDTQ